ncbi:MAG: DUF1648 domain-containing protein [Chthoniobacterales bacterium]
MSLFRKILPIFLTLIILIIASVVILHYGHTLPGRVATHFGSSGQPNGWMTRAEIIQVSLLFQWGFALLLPTLMAIIRFLPSEYINVPNANYWRMPENFIRGLNFLFFYSFWLCVLDAIFTIGIFLLMVDANRNLPVVINGKAMFLLLGAFLLGILIWIIRLILYFRNEGSEK